MRTSFSKILNLSSHNLEAVEAQSVDLIITSPPYPMIEMWDDCFSAQSPDVMAAIQSSDWLTAFEGMHAVLNRVWDECDRVLKDSGFICINIGDATRTCNGDFRLFSNHSKIIQYLEGKGYSCLPDIHWRKQSNAPNKFMGSGMFPAGAYVTYEHEYILIFRKGGKRGFKGENILTRRKSAYFWEERNVWFSDLWDVKGTSQTIKKCTSRERSASFPFEIPYRLINMYSAYGDTVLDPFGGFGTTALACAASHRNSILCDIDADICDCAKENLKQCLASSNHVVTERIDKHLQFIGTLTDEKLAKCYENKVHHFLVKTRQETELTFYYIKGVRTESDNELIFEYDDFADYSPSISIFKSPATPTV